MKMTRSQLNSNAFSLVEVVLAIGVVAFCLIPTFALLPMGLRATKDAAKTSSAANVLNELSFAIREATSTSLVGSSYSASGDRGPFSNWSWNLGATSEQSFYLSLSGQPTTRESAQFVAHSFLVASPDVSSASTVRTGSAKISVAWPATATWDTTTKAWINAEGSVSTGIVFIPRP